MSPKINQEKCIGCGTCLIICPSVFAPDENGKAKVIDPEACQKEDCQNAVSSCPVGAISLEE